MRHFLIKFFFPAIFISLVMLSSRCSSPPGDQKPQTHHVDIIEMKFSPTELTVNKGDTVIFINKDIITHNVTEQNDKKWASAPLQSDQSYKLVVKESAEYYCSFHPVMKGKLVVK